MKLDNEWESLVDVSLLSVTSNNNGDIPNILSHEIANMGTNISLNNNNLAIKSPESPKSPLKKRGVGKDNNLNTRAGELDGKFFCDKYRGIGALVNMRIAPTKGVECGQCNHLKMLQFSRPNDRRLFHWRCSKGFDILEAGFGGERILLSPAECDQYHDFNSGE